MAILLATKPQAMGAWRDALLALDPTLEVRLHPDAGDPATIEAVVMWTGFDLAELRRFPALKLVVSMGAGVDHLIRPPGPPPGIPVARLVDTRLTQGMSEWVLLNVLRFHRQDPDTERNNPPESGTNWPRRRPARAASASSASARWAAMRRRSCWPWASR